MKYENNRLSVLQNFVCTSENRIKLIEYNLPAFAKAFNPYPVLVWYDTLQYSKEVKKLYEDNIENLEFFIHDGKSTPFDWSATMLDLLSFTDSEYICYLCEDTIIDSKILTYEYLNVLLDEMDENNIDHLVLGKVDKYSKPHWHKKSKKTKNLWWYHSLKSPFRSFSCNAIFKRKLFQFNAEKTLGRGPGLFGLDASMDNNNIRILNIQCAVPRKVTSWHTHEIEGVCGPSKERKKI